MNGRWPETSLPSYNGWFRLAASVYMLDRGAASWALWGWWFVRSHAAVQWGRILAGRLESQESYGSCWRHRICRQICARVCGPHGLQCHGSCTNNFLSDLKMSFGLHHPSIRRSSSGSPPPTVGKGPLSRHFTSYSFSLLRCYINRPVLFSLFLFFFFFFVEKRNFISVQVR